MKDYIVLNGTDASVEGNYLAWNIPPDYFKHWEHNDDVYIKLSGCTFIGPSTSAGSSLTLSQAVIEGDTISTQNQTNTAGKTLFAIQPVTFQGDENGGTVFANNAPHSAPQYKTDRFQKIRLGVNNFDLEGLMVISDYKSLFVAVFEIEYVKHL